MPRARLEAADLSRRHSEAWREAQAGHLSRAQLRVMSAIETCRTAALGGHVEQCAACAPPPTPYTPGRTRHCPKCQGSAASAWLAARTAELLPVPYFHVVFTRRARLGAVASQTKALVSGLLFKVAAETLTTIAADPKRLGARIGGTAVLHTWGQSLFHPPHVHCIVPGGGLSPDGARWIPCRSRFFLPVRVLSRLFRRLFLQALEASHAAGQLQFFSTLAGLQAPEAFAAYLDPLRRSEWVVYAKRPFAGPTQVLAYLARYTHRVAIANSRLISLSGDHVRFRWKDYRQGGQTKVMTLDAGEFMRRFLLPPLPSGFRRIRYYGLFANGHRADRLRLCRQLLEAVPSLSDADPGRDRGEPRSAPDPHTCPCCGGWMVIIEAFSGRQANALRPVRAAMFDSS